MKMIVAMVLSALLSVGAHAALYNFEYEFDGDNFSAANGSSSIFGTNLSVGDTLNLSILASGNSYWDVSAANSVFTGNLFVLGLGLRSSSGSYTLTNDGNVLRTQNYVSPSQAFVHIGPNYTDFSGISAFDRWDLSLTLDYSSTSYNYITESFFGYTPQWSVFGADDKYSVNFVKSVPEPSTIFLMLLGLGCIILVRRKIR